MPRHIVRIRLDEDGKLKRESYLYARDIIHVMCVKQRVLRVEHSGGDRCFEILLPDYHATVKLQEQIEQRRHFTAEQLARA